MGEKLVTKKYDDRAQKKYIFGFIIKKVHNQPKICKKIGDRQELVILARRTILAMGNI